MPLSEADRLYINKQVNLYRGYCRQGNQPATEDCLYRIASCLELSQGADRYTPEIGQQALSWLRAHGWQV